MKSFASDPVALAREAWGEDAPDWVQALAAACAETSQAKVAARLDRSASFVSLVLRKTYGGGYDAAEELIRGVLLDAEIDCPELGTITTDECLVWRRRGRRFSNANSLRVRMFRACAGCPKAKEETRK